MPTHPITLSSVLRPEFACAACPPKPRRRRELVEFVKGFASFKEISGPGRETLISLVISGNCASHRALNHSIQDLVPHRMVRGTTTNTLSFISWSYQIVRYPSLFSYTAIIA